MGLQKLINSSQSKERLSLRNKKLRGRQDQRVHFIGTEFELLGPDKVKES